MGYKILIVSDDDLNQAAKRMEAIVKLWEKHTWQVVGGAQIVAKLTGPNPVRYNYLVYQTMTGPAEDSPENPGGAEGEGEGQPISEVEEIETDA